MTESEITVDKRARLSELASEYAYAAADGTILATARPFEQSAAGKVTRLLTDGRIGQGLQLCDAAGATVVTLRRAARLGRTRIVVADGAGTELARAEQQTLRRVDIRLTGGASATLEDPDKRGVFVFDEGNGDGRPVARVTRGRQPLGRRLFTKAERYVLEIEAEVDGPLRSLALAAPLIIDLTFPRDAAGQELVTAFGN